MRIIKHKKKYRVVSGYLWWKVVHKTLPTERNAEIWIERYAPKD